MTFQIIQRARHTGWKNIDMEIDKDLLSISGETDPNVRADLRNKIFNRVLPTVKKIEIKNQDLKQELLLWVLEFIDFYETRWSPLSSRISFWKRLSRNLRWKRNDWLFEQCRYEALGRGEILRKSKKSKFKFFDWNEWYGQSEPNLERFVELLEEFLESEDFEKIEDAEVKEVIADIIESVLYDDYEDKKESSPCRVRTGMDIGIKVGKSHSTGVRLRKKALNILKEYLKRRDYE